MRGVPVSFIWGVCYPRSNRPVKKVPWKEPVPYSHITHMAPAALQPRIRAGMHGNVPEDDYKYFKGEPNPERTFCTCRFCGTSLTVHHGIAIHKEESQCCHKIDFAHAYLSKEKMCVVCDQQTAKSKWGVPLCSPVCENNFRWGPVPPVYKDAITYTRNAKPGIKVGHVTL